MSQNFVKGEFVHHKHGFILFYIYCVMEKSVKNKTKTNQT